MKKGLGVFGKEYAVMLKNDPHGPKSMDRQLMEGMILLDPDSAAMLYAQRPQTPDLRGHELYAFAQGFRQGTEQQTIEKILLYCSDIAEGYDAPLEELRFGGTEAEILRRGTAWCADMARLGLVLLGCNGIPARLVYLANLDKAYYGHVVVEAYYEGTYGICDFIHGYLFYQGRPLSAYDLLREKAFLAPYPEDYRGLYSAAAISDYDPMQKHCYEITPLNAYIARILQEDHQGQWFMGEDQNE